jgi:hypothetical protein
MSVIKTIKFDLPIDGVKVKTIDELKNHFTTEVINLYKNGLLSRWLQSQGMGEYVQALSNLSPQANDALLLSSLCEIFNVAIDDQELLSQLASHHSSGIKIDPEELKYKSKYEALVSESKPKGKIMGFDNEFIGPEINMEMLVKMHKHHTGEDIILVPVWISQSNYKHSSSIKEFNHSYLQNIGDFVNYNTPILSSEAKNPYGEINTETYNKNTIKVYKGDQIEICNNGIISSYDYIYAKAYAPCAGVLYKKIRVNDRDLLKFYKNAYDNFDPIIVAYLRIDM